MSAAKWWKPQLSNGAGDCGGPPGHRVVECRQEATEILLPQDQA